MKRSPTFSLTVLTFGFVFLYAPMVLLIVYSFNDSRLVSVWGGFSTRWYEAVFTNRQLIDAAKVSFFVAMLAATLSTFLGTISGVIMSRHLSFKGRTLFSGLVTAPIVMPEIIIGLALLLLFVSLRDLFGWPDRGITTIVIAHTTLCMAYVTVIVRSRMTQMDKSVEEAAMDLGARPLKVFFFITLPIISPALVAGWLLAFTLSLDDLVIASFVSAPGASTLPMVIFSSIRMGVTPEANVLATLLIVMAILTVSLVGWLTMRKTNKDTHGT